MVNIDKSLQDRWKDSRSGAWAGRGFHYQHLFTTLLLITQWAGLSPLGSVVPEGLEDCVIELPEREYWIQIKSRESGIFSQTEVDKFLIEVSQKSSGVKSEKEKQISIVLEQPCVGVDEKGIDQLFKLGQKQIIVSRSPEKDALDLLSKKLNTAEIIVEGIFSDLYTLVVKAATSNTSVSYENRKNLSATDVENRIYERLEAEDSSAIDIALSSRVLEPLCFSTSIPEPAFYRGVKVKPGHVTAGIVIGRPEETDEVAIMLRDRRQVDINGPSGAGKSALLWLAANKLSSDFRWFQITQKAGPQDGDSIVRFIRSRRPSEASPLALTFDEINTTNIDLWNILVNEFRGLPFVYLLGSIRKEDLPLITNQSDTGFYETILDENLAAIIWEKLLQKKETNWPHWQEPFEQSDGLMLEYVHILTAGERLAALISEQVRLREKEGRNDELSIIRTTSALCSLGGEIDANRLIKLLKIPSERASQAIKRLIDEHIVIESRPGVLGGLHPLRSKALCDASHDKVVYRHEESRWLGVSAATFDTLPRIIKAIFTGREPGDKNSYLKKLAEMLRENPDPEFWSAVFTGLGISTLERYVSSFIEILEKNGVQRAQWSLASMFFDRQTQVPELPGIEQWNDLRQAIQEFRGISQLDYRQACFELLPYGTITPPLQNLEQANQLLSSFTPIAGGPPIIAAKSIDINQKDNDKIEVIAGILSTAYLIDPEYANLLSVTFGGEQSLLSRFRSETPWLDNPKIIKAGEHGRTVHADWYYVGDDYQTDPHGTIVNICKILMALSPASDAAASEAIDPTGNPIVIGDQKPHSKNMPRKNLPAEARVAWNKNFRQILLSKVGANSLTYYSQQMAQLVVQTEKNLRSFSERWIKGTNAVIAEKMKNEISEITYKINSLAYARPKILSSLLAGQNSSGEVEDQLGALLTGVLGNLIPRMVSLEPKVKGIAVFASDLSAQARDHQQSPIWRTTASPPLDKLDAISKRLKEISSILHEIAFDSSQESIKKIIKAGKKSNINKAISAAARYCNSQAKKRFEKIVKNVETVLGQRGWDAKCWTRPVNEKDSVSWPSVEIAISIYIDSLLDNASYIEDVFTVAQEYIGHEWRYRIVPVINKKVISGLALLGPSLSQQLLPDYDFDKEWRPYIDLPFLQSKFISAFETAFSACSTISAIFHCRDIENLHTEEDKALSKAVEVFQKNYDIILDQINDTDLDELHIAGQFINNVWSQIEFEYNAFKDGKTVDTPFCMNIYQALSGNEFDTELAVIRLSLFQACAILNPNTPN